VGKKILPQCSGNQLTFLDGKFGVGTGEFIEQSFWKHIAAYEIGTHGTAPTVPNAD
jgi:hypothetical protein